MNRPLQITWSGSESSFMKCRDVILQKLNEETFSWKRSESTLLPCQIRFAIEFVSFSPKSVKNANLCQLGTVKRLIPLCHFYFVDIQDQDKIKDIRSNVSQWLIDLDSNGYNDCLIISDVGHLKENKSKGLILERLKTDFPKISNRIFQTNLTQKKGLPLLLRQVTETIFQGLDKVVQFYESCLKADRDNCFSIYWNFDSYYINQIQLSEIYVALRLFDSALDQLEELDAALSLLISYFENASLKPQWIELIFKRNKSRPMLNIRNLVENIGQVLELMYENIESEAKNPSFQLGIENSRLILFACQMNIVRLKFDAAKSNKDVDSIKIDNHLLCEKFISYGNKIIQRLREERMSYSQRAGSTESNEETTIESFHRVLLIDEIICLAAEFGELYEISNYVEDLSNLWVLLCNEADKIKSNFESSSAVFVAIKEVFNVQLPSHLCTLLDSSDSYYAQYVKWHESALALLKHKGWNNTASLIALNLAGHYMNCDEKPAAATFYSKCLRSFQNSNFVLAFASIFEQCTGLLHYFSYFDRFLFLCEYCCSCSNGASLDEAFKMLENFSQEKHGGSRTSLEARSSWLKIENLQVVEQTGAVNSIFNIEFELFSHFPHSLLLSNNPDDIAKVCVTRFENESSFVSRCTNKLLMKEKVDDLNCELVCPNEKSIFGYYAKRKSEAPDFATNCCCLSPSNHDSAPMIMLNVKLTGLRELKSGVNKIAFTFKPQKSGVYTFDHIHLNTNSLCLTKIFDNAHDSKIFVDVVDMKLNLISTENKPLTGITQHLRLTIDEGSECDTDSDSIQQKDIILKSMNSNLYFTDSDQNRYEKRIALEDCLRPLSSYETTLPVFCSLDGKEKEQVCEISVNYNGIQKIFKIVFYSLMAWNFETHWLGSKILLIEFQLRNLSDSMSITIKKANLEMSKNVDPVMIESEQRQGRKIAAELVNKLIMNVSPNSVHNIVWKVENEFYDEGTVYIIYSAVDGGETFECWASFLFNNFPVIEANCQVACESTVCRVDLPCDFIVSLKADHVMLKCAELNVKLFSDISISTVQNSSKELQNEYLLNGLTKRELLGETNGFIKTLLISTGLFEDKRCKDQGTPFWQSMERPTYSPGSLSTMLASVRISLKENGLGQAFFRLSPCLVGFLPCPKVQVDVVSPLCIQCRTYVRSQGKQIHVLAPMHRSKTTEGSKSKLLFT